MVRKILSCFVIALLACVALPGCGGSPHEKAAANQIAMMNELSDRLEKIKTDADLTAAKPDLEALGTKMKAMEAELKQLPPMTADEQTAVNAKFKADEDKAGTRMKDQMERLTKDVSPMAPLVVLDDLKLNPADLVP